MAEKTAKNDIMQKATTNRSISNKRGNSIFDLISSDKMKSQFAMALPKHVDTERFVRIALTCIRQNPKLAECSRESLLGALMTSSQLGLEPGGVLGQAYLIPFSVKGQMECQFQIGYKGMLELLRRSGQLSNIRVHTVYENDEFEIGYGLDCILNHKPVFKDRGKMIGFYAVAELKDKSKQFHFMSYDDILEHEKTHRKGNYQTNVWKQHFEAMAHKTVVKLLMKWLPVSVEFLEMASKDEGVYKASEENLKNIKEEIENPTLEYNNDTGEIIEIENKSPDDIISDVFK
ncbi:recombinase RecT [uncultured Ilyobacter sp.]|uniref:recombinase RecT n=1 Tax=uncultured Ilyobacter sp. TaxID=544433 RepID=UPI002AA65451|nr:recombinase RecT [uncultured Ilyobacter sp.]